MKLDHIKKGFYSLIPYDIVSIFNVNEFDFMISGQNEIDLNDWKTNTVYMGYYNGTHPVNDNIY